MRFEESSFRRRICAREPNLNQPPRPDPLTASPAPWTLSRPGPFQNALGCPPFRASCYKPAQKMDPSKTGLWFVNDVAALI